MSGWSNQAVDSITIPSGAADTDPRIVIGQDIPAELTAHYEAAGTPIVGAILSYSAQDVYFYEAALSDPASDWNEHLHARGYVYHGTVYEYEELHIDEEGNLNSIHGLYQPMQFIYGNPVRDPDDTLELFRTLHSMTFLAEGPFQVTGTAEFFTTVDILPPASSSSQAVTFNHGYAIYVDNTGAGSANNRMWISAPNGGEVIIGPRTGSSYIGSLRLRTNATTSSAANCFIDPTTHTIRRSTSSLKYKQDVQDAQFDLSRIRALRPVRFRDRAEVERLDDQARMHVGLIAEEVHALGLGEFVLYDEEGNPDSVQYDRIIVGLLQWIKHLEQRVNQLESGAA